ncbi:MAG: hypothetical protein ACR2RB_10820 [Gammaproteobacteria bacterium]
MYSAETYSSSSRAELADDWVKLVAELVLPAGYKLQTATRADLARLAVDTPGIVARTEGIASALHISIDQVRYVLYRVEPENTHRTDAQARLATIEQCLDRDSKSIV